MTKLLAAILTAIVFFGCYFLATSHANACGQKNCGPNNPATDRTVKVVEYFVHNIILCDYNDKLTGKVWKVKSFKTDNGQVWNIKEYEPHYTEIREGSSFKLVRGYFVGNVHHGHIVWISF